MSKTLEMVSLELFAALEARVAALEAKLAEKPKTSGTEMTDAMAHTIIYGEDAALKHKDAGEKHGLTYGQVYSARLGFTFKNVHKAAKDAGLVNAWMK